MYRDCKAILFDAVGTLIYPDPAVAVAYYQAGFEYGSRLSVSNIRTRFRDAFSRQESTDRAKTAVDHDTTTEYVPEPPPLGPDKCAQSICLDRQPTSESRERNRWRQIIQDVFEDVPQADQGLFSQLWQHFGQSHNWSLFDDVEVLWSRLRSTGRVLGIASNFDSRLSAICRKLPPLDHASSVFCSSDIGFPKPSPHFFREIESRLHMRPCEILLVGDDWENDLCGALAAGWHGLHLDRSATHDDQHTITSLEELLAVLACE